MSNQHSHSDIKLPITEEQWLFNVFLDNPVGVFLFVPQHLQNIVKVRIDLDALASIELRWLHDPHIGVTMLGWHSLLIQTLFLDLVEPTLQYTELIIHLVTCEYEASGHGVEGGVVVQDSGF